MPKPILIAGLTWTLALACGSAWAHGDSHPRIAQAQADAKAHPEDPQFQLKLAELLRQHGELGEALATYERATQIKTLTDPTAWLGLAFCANRLGQPAKAETASLEAARLMPQSASAQFELGMALQSQGQLKPATQAFGRAFELEPDPDKALAWLRSGASILEWREHKANVEKARRSLGDLASLLDSAVSLARSKGEFKDALAWQEARLKAEGEQPLLLETQGDILQAMGKRSKARKAWGKALQAWKLLPESRRQTPALLGLPERVKIKGGGS